MKYKHAPDILPDQLLKELQKYVSGETIYVPNVQSRKQWGESSGARHYYRERHEEIREKFRSGATIDDLAKDYALSTDSIRKIVY